jgi:hypothetical protein
VTEVLHIARLMVGTVFLFSAAGKLRDPRSFARGIEDYEILPTRVVTGASLIIIAVEGWLAVSHLMVWWLRLAVPVGVGMFASFTVAVAVNLLRGRALPCYCFDTTGGESISVRTLARLLLLLSTELFLLANASLFTRNQIVDEQIHPLIDPGLAWFWAMFLLVAFSWLFTLPELAELLRPSKTRVVQAAATGLPKGRFWATTLFKTKIRIRLPHLGARAQF